MSINHSENYINKVDNTANSLEIENYYKKSHSNNIYLKTYSNFYHKPKIRIIKNKTPSSKLHIFHYPSLRKTLTEKKNSIYNPSYSLIDNEQNYKDSLFLEVIKAQKNIKEINKELKIVQDDYDILEQQNFSNFYIMQKILEKYDIKEEKNNNFQNNNNLKLWNNKNNKIKKKKNNIQYGAENNKIYVLKKQINSYDLIIQNNEKKLEEIHQKEKQIRYKELMNLLYNKEKEINEQTEQINEYNYILFEENAKLNFYNLKAQQYNNDIIKLEKKLRYNNELIYENNEEIKAYNKKKKNLRNSKKILIDQIKIREKEIDSLNKEENSCDKQIKENKTLFIEKEKNENILFNLKIKKEKIISDINKIEKKLSIVKRDNSVYNKDLEEYGKKWPELLKKSKIPELNQDIMKGLEKEIENNKNEIKKRDEEDGNKEKNMSDKFQEIIDLNSNYLIEINGFENEKNDWILKVNNLKIVLENNKNKNELLKKEILELEKIIEKNKDEYEKQKKEEEEKNKKEKFEKENRKNKKKKDNELKEKNYKEAEEKYNKEINELKEKKEVYKKQKEELLTQYNEKMKNVKQMNEAEAKLKKILEEIKKLSPS